jgi:hypothetical protein
MKYLYLSYMYSFVILYENKRENNKNPAKRKARGAMFAVISQMCRCNQLLNLRFLAASDFFLRLTLGFS